MLTQSYIDSIFPNIIDIFFKKTNKHYRQLWPINLTIFGVAQTAQNAVQLLKTKAVFYFFIFIFVFYKNIFLFLKFTEIYPGRPAAGRPAPGHPAAGRQGLICKNFRKKIAFRSLRDRSPGSRAAGPPGRPAAGRPVHVSWFFNIFRGREELVFHLSAGLIVTGSLLSLSLHRANQHLLFFFHAKHSRAIN